MPNVPLIFHRRHGRASVTGCGQLPCSSKAVWRLCAAQYKDAEQSLLASLTLNPDDMEALYTIGVVRMAVGADEGAARAFAHVARAGGPLEPAAATRFGCCTRAGAGDAGTSFDAWRAGLTWNPPEAPVAATRTREPGRYAGSQACRECHAQAYTTLGVDGHGANVQSLPARRRDRRLLRHADRVGPARAPIKTGRGTSSRSAAARTTSGFAIRSITSSDRNGSRPTRRSLPDSRMLVFPIQYSRAALGVGQLLGPGGRRRVRRAPTSRNFMRAGRCRVSDDAARRATPVSCRSQGRVEDLQPRPFGKAASTARCATARRWITSEWLKSGVSLAGGRCDTCQLSTPAGRAVRRGVRAMPRAVRHP